MLTGERKWLTIDGENDTIFSNKSYLEMGNESTRKCAGETWERREGSKEESL